ncbi:hypothetical protein PRZ48_003441 [Zasmidium cellare]|uniref:C2H2-type domain-containing protein n=1 Tax=Zasmidium cellare TaxID=395010 RepID=A0ABR0EX99_ZASCE|nr:hypothetical protein PRZ48_003441 [Zasmidium cellare]
MDTERPQDVRQPTSYSHDEPAWLPPPPLYSMPNFERQTHPKPNESFSQPTKTASNSVTSLLTPPVSGSSQRNASSTDDPYGQDEAADPTQRGWGIWSPPPVASSTHPSTGASGLTLPSLSSLDLSYEPPYAATQPYFVDEHPFPNTWGSPPASAVVSEIPKSTLDRPPAFSLFSLSLDRPFVNPDLIDPASIDAYFGQDSSHRPQSTLSHSSPVLSNLSNPGGTSHEVIPASNSGHAAKSHQLYGYHSQELDPQNDRPFRCDQCPQTFNRNHDLKRHKRIHLASRPFPCGHCGKSFSLRDALKPSDAVPTSPTSVHANDGGHDTNVEEDEGTVPQNLWKTYPAEKLFPGDPDAVLVPEYGVTKDDEQSAGKHYPSPQPISSGSNSWLSPHNRSQASSFGSTNKSVPSPMFYPTPTSSVSSGSRSSTYTAGDSNRGLCPIATCGRHVKDLKAHMLTHQTERPEKCPISTCEYHIKGFARKYDKNRHTLTHYKGLMVCGFCPGAGSAAEKSFNRADVFKRHLTSVHGVEQVPPNARKRSAPMDKQSELHSTKLSGMCSVCGNTFESAQVFYEHLDDCMIKKIEQPDLPFAAGAEDPMSFPEERGVGTKDTHLGHPKHDPPAPTSVPLRTGSSLTWEDLLSRASDKALTQDSEVLKSSAVRDQVMAQREVIGFEMEDARCWDTFPTIAVKSVCDYADSHKDKQWQALQESDLQAIPSVDSEDSGYGSVYDFIRAQAWPGKDATLKGPHDNIPDWAAEDSITVTREEVIRRTETEATSLEQPKHGSPASVNGAADSVLVRQLFDTSDMPSESEIATRVRIEAMEKAEIANSRDSGYYGAEEYPHARVSKPQDQDRLTPQTESDEPLTIDRALPSQRHPTDIGDDDTDTSITQVGTEAASAQRLAELRDIISDLQQRTESLLRRTRPRAHASGESSPRDSTQRHSSRSHSSPPPFERLRGDDLVSQDADAEGPGLEESPGTPSSDVLSTPTPSPSNRSDSGAPYNRSRRFFSPRDTTRSRSEPPRRRRSAPATAGAIHLHNSQTAAAGSFNANRAQDNQANGKKSTQKRKVPHDEGQYSGDGDQNNRPSGPKRCKLTGRQDDGSDKERFPCIFHAGQPERYKMDDKKYEYISQLLRHLRRHDFYACAKCYTKFEDGEAQDLHAHENPCLKSCRSKRCTRFLPAGTVREAACECIVSPEQQWRQLFLLQYPNLSVPDLAQFQSQTIVQEVDPVSDGMALDGLWSDFASGFGLPPPEQEGMNDATSDDTVFNSIEMLDFPGGQVNTSNGFAQPVNQNIDPQQFGLPLPGPSVVEANGASREPHDVPPPPQPNIQIDENFFTEVQTLRERVVLLEQRLSQPSDREQDLEMVLGNVWQALVRTRSADAQPESPVWRLVRRFAGSILSTVPRSSAESQPTGTQTAPSSFQWQDLLGACGPPVPSGSRTGGDSGYGSLP